MGATLEALQRLQAIETQLRSIREQIETKRLNVDAHRRKITTLQRQAADAHESIRRAQAESDKLELERKSQEARLAKLRETLKKIKTNKEYHTVLAQINTDEADARKFEDQVLAAMTKVDDLKQAEANLKLQLEKEQARTAELEKAARETEQKLAGQLSTLESQRDQAAEGIPAEALRSFERACEHHDGEAMAMIEQPHPKRAEYICSGCYMSIPLESINALQSRDAIITCHNCSRILFLESHGLTV